MASCPFYRRPFSRNRFTELAAGTLDKSRSVTTAGPYAIMRNPMYVGSFCMMASFCIMTRDLPTGLFVFGPLAILYRMQIHFEEKRLLFLFPEDWPPYAKHVPSIIPTRWSPHATKGWTRERWRQNREYKALAATALGVGLVAIWHFVVRDWSV